MRPLDVEIALREVAESTKISVRHLEALETNDFESLPEGTVFRKGFVRAFCEHIGIDAESMLNAYLLEERARAERGAAADNGVMRGRGVRAAAIEPVASPPPRRALLWAVIAALAIIAGGGLAWWAWNALDRDEPGSESTSLALFRAGDDRG